jgi:predicted MFS family arabinose efflux permease
VDVPLTSTRVDRDEHEVGRLSVAGSLVALFSVAVGVSVANLYYLQPLLPLLRRDYHVAPGLAALATTATQLGYVLGLALILPLADLLERRRLVVAMTLSCAAALALAASAPVFALLLVGLLLVGVTAVVAQILVPFAAALSPARERGRVVGTVMSGLLLGILLARTVAGFVAAASSWRVLLDVAAGAMAATALALRARLPVARPATSLPYGRLLASLVELVRTEPVLRRRALFGALGMGCFSTLWTSVAFLLAGAPYHYSVDRIGLFGLVGAAGALMANLAGRLADRGQAPRLTVFAAGCLAASFLLIYLGSHSLVPLVAGIVVLDVGAQGMQITNQSEIYRLRADAGARVNSVYMVSYFVGGTAASALSGLLYARAGWAGVSALGGSLGTAALALGLVSLRRPPGRRTGSGRS